MKKYSPGTVISSLTRRLLLLSHRCLIGVDHLLSDLRGRPRFYAEFGSDKFLRQQFFPKYSYAGTLVEVGCATPRLLSFSQHFREAGWRCIGIEPNPNFAQLHRQSGNEVYEVAVADFEGEDVPFQVIEDSSTYSDSTLSAHSFSALSIRDDYARYRGGFVKSLKRREIQVKVKKLDSVLSEALPPISSVDVVCIDVEGYELDVMRGFSPEKFGTKVIVLENLFHRSEYEEYMTIRGFRLVKKLKYNYFFEKI